jgi:signal recognition particle subunit SRP54
MFKNLSDKLQGLLSKLKGQAYLTEENVHEIIRHIKMALLEADVNYKVVKKFIESVKQEALGKEVARTLNPDKVFVKIVNDALVNVLGGNGENKLNISSRPPTIIMLVGLQGSGKTSTAAKLAYYLKNKKVMLTAADIYRPAAIDQLETLGKNLNIPVYANRSSQNVVRIVEESLNYCRKQMFDVNIIDTAGRLHVDETMMNELVQLKKLVNPDEILLVIDSMVGQDVVNQAARFNEKLDITGVILTKLDSDVRGGAALSIKEIVGKPIKFIGVGEKPGDFEPFYPDRMASRILGMGDVVTLVEKAQNAIDEKQAKDLERKISKDGLNFNDLLRQFNMIKKMGTVENILKLIPGFTRMPQIDDFDDKFKRVEAIINSMTPLERRDYRVINSSRKKRIARGSGTSVREINKLIEQLQQMNKMLKIVKTNKGKVKKLDKTLINNMFQNRR